MFPENVELSRPLWRVPADQTYQKNTHITLFANTDCWEALYSHESHFLSLKCARVHAKTSANHCNNRGTPSISGTLTAPTCVCSTSWRVDLYVAFLNEQGTILRYNAHVFFNVMKLRVSGSESIISKSGQHAILLFKLQPRLHTSLHIAGARPRQRRTSHPR